MRKILLILLIIIAIFFSVFSFAKTASAANDPEFKVYDVSGTAREEMIMEGLMMSNDMLTIAPLLPFIATQEVFTEKYTPLWLQWPSGRYTFCFVPVDKLSLIPKDLSTPVIGETIANLFFTMTKYVTRISISFLALAFNTSFVNFMADFMQNMTRVLFSPEGSMSRIFLLMGVIALLLFGAYKILKGQVTSALTSLCIAALAVGMVFYFSANMSNIVNGITNVTDGITNEVLSALSGVSIDALAQKEDLRNEMNKYDQYNSNTKGIIAASDVAWKIIVVYPWRTALFGTCRDSDLKITTSVPANIVGKSEWEVLESNKGDFGEDEKYAWPIVKKIKNEKTADTLILATSPGTREREIAVESFGRPNEKKLWGIFGGNAVYHGDHSGSTIGMSPGNVWEHVKIAVLSLIPAFGFAALAILVGGSIIVCQFILVIMFLFLPFILFTLFIPDAGWNIAMKYGRTLLGFLAVKLIYGIYLAVVLSVALAMCITMMNSLYS